MIRALMSRWFPRFIVDNDMHHLEKAIHDPQAAREFLFDLHFDLTLRCAIRAEIERRALLSLEESPLESADCECPLPQER